VELVLDDFSVPTADAMGWSVFTDRVMGGLSDAQGALVEVQGRRALRLTGRVSLERNGGFVQMARRLGPGPGTSRDARAFSGLALTVCGTPGPYFVHLRTADTRAPWQYYGAPLPVTGMWQEVLLPWRAFSPVALSTPLDVSGLQRLGIVAAKVAFDADVAVSRVALR
jgi:hypothetical protein